MEATTPIWLGIIITLLGYVINILEKAIKVYTNKQEPFHFQLWWQTNKLNTLLSVAVVVLLLLIFPDVTKLITVNGSEELGERAMYALIGYMPLKIWQMILKQPNKLDAKRKLNI